jgi:hypothetical protein
MNGRGAVGGSGERDDSAHERGCTHDQSVQSDGRCAIPGVVLRSRTVRPSPGSGPRRLPPTQLVVGYRVMPPATEWFPRMTSASHAVILVVETEQEKCRSYCRALLTHRIGRAEASLESAVAPFHTGKSASRRRSVTSTSTRTSTCTREMRR